MARRTAGVVLWALSVVSIVAGVATPSQAATSVTDLDHGATAAGLVSLLAGAGVSTSNVTYTGSNVSAGTFSGAASSVGFDSGVVLGSGRVQTVDVDPNDPCATTSGDGVGVEGPNDCDGNTTETQQPGDTDLSALAGAGQNPPVPSLDTFDASILQFDFVPQGNHLTFSYVFTSEEYNHYVNSEFNDVFAFYVNGVNCATVPGTNPPLPVSVNTINNGNPFGTTPNSHPELYRNNDLDDPGPPTIDLQPDGLTTVLTCSADVNPGVTNHIKLAIADASDAALDSNVFIQAGTFSAPTTTTTTSTSTTTTSTTSTTTPTTTTSTSTTTTSTSTTTTSTSTTTTSTTSTTAPTTTTSTTAPTTTTSTTAPTTTTSTTAPTTTTSTSPECSAPKPPKPGNGFGDKNHCHTGPPGQQGPPDNAHLIASSGPGGPGPRSTLILVGILLALIALPVTGVPVRRRVRS